MRSILPIYSGIQQGVLCDFILRQTLRVPWYIRTKENLKEFKFPDIIELTPERRFNMIDRLREWGAELPTARQHVELRRVVVKRATAPH